ncbi:MAG: uroporphyrinogen-III C-methyltransferase [Spirochaetota bacterium]|nr:uroporphyrinogen-III C-methyltransferase [Spirochaetota bacterium]
MKKIVIGNTDISDNKTIQFLKDFFSEIEIVAGKSNLDYMDSILSGETDLYISPYDFEFSKISVDNRFLYTTLPKIANSPFGKSKKIIVFLRSRVDIIQMLSLYFGKVWIVGAGAGDKDLITLKGFKRLKNCDVIITDYLLDKQILKNYVSKNTLIISLTLFGRHGSSQDLINETLLQNALLFNRVVRLKGGDPFVFGRGGEECEYLIPYNIEYEIVPGISAMLSALSYAGIPLTHRDYNAGFIVITGYRKECENDIDCQTRIAEKINFALSHELMAVVFMSRTNWKNFSHMIIKQYMPVAIIESGAYPYQRVFTSTVKETNNIINKMNLKSPTLIVIGENVKEREKLKWFENLPLHSKKILSFSSELLSNELYNEFSDIGANIKSIELYDLLPEKISSVDKYFKTLSEYDFIIITSRNAFEMLISILKQLRIDIRKMPKLIVTGKKTEEEFNAIGIIPDIVPKVFSSDGIIAELSNISIKGKKFIFPKSSLSKGDISSYIIDQGGIIDEFILYNNVPKKLSEETINEIKSFKPDYVIFTSSSSVDYYFNNIENDNISFTAISIGDKTSKTLREHNISNIMEAKSFTTEGIKDLLLSNIK